MSARAPTALAELGLTLPAGRAPVAAYVPGRRDAGLVCTAGQLPLVDGALAGDRHSRRARSTPAQGRRARRPCALNALAAIGVRRRPGRRPAHREGRRVRGQRARLHGPAGCGQRRQRAARAVFGEAGRHARSAVGVAALPLGAPVEVEVVAALR